LLLRKRISNRRLWSTKEGVGETSGQTAGPVFSMEFALAKTGSAEERSFLHRCGSKGPRFHRRLRRLGFGPDVFADALVPRRRVVDARALISQIPKVDLPESQRSPDAGRRAAFLRVGAAEPRCRVLRDIAPGIAPMVIALPNGRVNRIPRITR
jgi:hypothetical protein